MSSLGIFTLIYMYFISEISPIFYLSEAPQVLQIIAVNFPFLLSLQTQLPSAEGADLCARDDFMGSFSLCYDEPGSCLLTKNTYSGSALDSVLPPLGAQEFLFWRLQPEARGFFLSFPRKN